MAKKLTYKQALSKSKKLQKKGFRLTKAMKSKIIKAVIKEIKNG